MAKKTDNANKNRKIASKRPGPEKAGVGGSTPSRGTILLNNLPISTILAVGTESISAHLNPRSSLIRRPSTAFFAGVFGK